MNYRNNMTPRKVDQWFAKAFAAHNAGQLEEAVAIYRRILQKTPTDLETLYLLGTAYCQMEQYDDAFKYLKRVLAIKPDYPEAMNNLGMAYRKCGELTEAVKLFRRALELKPGYADGLSNLGGALQELKELDEAEEHLRHALRLNPALTDAYYGLGLVLEGKDKFLEASQCFQRVLQLQPNYAEAYDELGTVHRLWGHLQEALECFERALSLKGNLYSAHNNLATVLEEMGRYEEAEQAYERAVALNPEGGLIAKWNKATFYLTQGKLEKGWEAYELRFQRGVARRFPYPEWDGGSLDGKTLLIYAEQGLGDEILFASCIPDMLARAKHCVIECEPRLASLFARSFPNATVVGGDRLQIGWLLNVPPIDVQSAIGSLPRYLRPTLESFPATESYLVADPQRVAYWRSRLALLGTGLKVGICWRSGLMTGYRHKYYSQLTQWGEIFKVAGVHFVNLQYDECADELREAEQKFGVGVTVFPELDLRNEIDESAALMKALDLVISAGTSVAEIAASLGVETWRVDNYIKPWPALGTDYMPWHPTERWFRQPAAGDWDTPLALVAKTLNDKVLGVQETTEYVPLPGGVEVAVKGSLEDASTYVLKEQVGWFDPEYSFVLRMAQPNMRIVDVGAGVGQYAVPLAMSVKDGKLLAITCSADDTSMVMKSRERNRLEDRLRVSIADDNLSLDAEMEKHGFEGVGFVRIAQGMWTSELVERGCQFFSANSPLVMFGARAGGDVDVAAVERLRALGYRLYRLVPGLDLLVPFTSAVEMDVFAVNLFACKDDRADALEHEGKLAQQPGSVTDFPGVDRPYWQTYLGTMPFASNKLETWTRSKPDGWEIYWMALNLYALAKTANSPASLRIAHLQVAENVMRSLIQELATMPRLLSLCRILSDLGKREAAVNLLNQICVLLSSGAPCALDEPCLALMDAFASASPGGKETEWIVAMVLAQREMLLAFSTYFSGQDSLQALREVKASGFGCQEVERRIQLIEARFAAHGR